VWLVRDCLRQSPERIGVFWPAAAIDSGIAGGEWSQICPAVFILAAAVSVLTVSEFRHSMLRDVHVVVCWHCETL